MTAEKKKVREQLQNRDLRKVSRFTNEKVKRGVLSQDRRLEKAAKKLYRVQYGSRKKDEFSKAAIKQRHDMNSQKNSSPQNLEVLDLLKGSYLTN